MNTCYLCGYEHSPETSHRDFYITDFGERCCYHCYVTIYRKRYRVNRTSKFLCVYRTKHPAGYIYIKSPNHPRCTVGGFVLEHIIIIEKYIGRYLRYGEVVHHINGIKNDNRIENLRLMTNLEHAYLHNPKTIPH